MNVVMTGDGRLVEVQATAERDPFSRELLDALLDLAAGGIDELAAAQREAASRRARERDTRLDGSSSPRGNPHKLDELRRALPGLGDRAPRGDDEPAEDGATFARQRADQGAARPALARRRTTWVAGRGLRDRGRRRSAAGPGVAVGPLGRGRRRAAARRARRASTDRGARYVCVLVALAPDGARGRRRRARSTGAIAPTRRAATRASATTRSSSRTARRARSPSSATHWKAAHSHRAQRRSRARTRTRRREPEVAFAPMDAAEALAELMELSSQIEAAVVLGERRLRARLAPGRAERREALARGAPELVAAAVELRAARREVTRVEVELDGRQRLRRPRGRRTTVAATTGPGSDGRPRRLRPPTCAAGGSTTPKPKKRRARKPKEEAE